MAILRHPPLKELSVWISGFFHMLHFTTFATFCCKKKLQCFCNILLLSKYFMVFNNFDVKKVLMISNFLSNNKVNPLVVKTVTWAVISPYIGEKLIFWKRTWIFFDFFNKNKVNPLVVKTVIWAVISPYIGKKLIFWKHTWNFFWFV